MSQPRPTSEQIAAAIREAESASTAAAAVRARYHRRRSPRREPALAAAKERCEAAASPLRSFIGMVAWHDLPVEEELAMKAAMQKLRYERRQIAKML